MVLCKLVFVIVPDSGEGGVIQLTQVYALPDFDVRAENGAVIIGIGGKGDVADQLRSSF